MLEIPASAIPRTSARGSYSRWLFQSQDFYDENIYPAPNTGFLPRPKTENCQPGNHRAAHARAWV